MKKIQYFLLTNSLRLSWLLSKLSVITLVFINKWALQGFVWLTPRLHNINRELGGFRYGSTKPTKSSEG
jgi:hypothetical protein